MELTGLTTQEALARQAAGQGNRGGPPTGRSYWQIFRENIFTFINNVLFGLGIALVALGLPSDALVSVGVIMVNVLVSVVQEIRAKRMLDKIALLTRPTATVIRDGTEKTLDPVEIVSGDLLMLNPGDQATVDGTITGDGSLEMDESLLTGESDLIRKQAGDKILSGSFCVTGSGYFTAEQVGQNSYANQLTSQARAFRRVLTPLQQQINLAIRVILVMAVYYEVLLVVNTILKGIPAVESVKMSVVIAGLVPNGLFLAIAVAYAMGAVRIAGKGALVQQSNAVESLSNVDILCLDKTGTLTANRISVDSILPAGLTKEKLSAALGNFAASATTSNRTSEALAEAFPSKPIKAIEEVDFSSARKWSALTLEESAKSVTYVLGAPEILRNSLSHENDLFDQVKTWADQGLRVLLFASYPAPQKLKNKNDEVALPPGLVPLGLVALKDELRPEASKTLKEFQKAGVRLKIISGDNPQTVAALARQAGLGPDFKLISGPELEKMNPTEFDEWAEEGTIFGRITPQQKQRLVKSLRGQGHYVAMIGDGVNDVLSLKQSNLGIAMQSGSQAARGVADIILLKDSFKALPFAVREGQRIIKGMQDILKIFLSRVMYATIMILSTGMLGAFPLSPKHNSLMTLFTVGIPSLAIAAWAQSGPIPSGNFIRRMFRFVIPAAFTQSLFGLGVYVIYLAPIYWQALKADPNLSQFLATGAAQPVAQTALTIFSIISGLLLVVFVEPPIKFFVGGDSLSKDWRPTILAAGLLVVFVLLMAVPPIRSFFDLESLGIGDFFILGGLAALWALLVRLIWRGRTLERFMSADFGEAANTNK